MWSILNTLDFFPNIVGLRYSGKWRFSSPLGGFLSIITMIGTMSIIGYFGYIYLTPSQSKRTSFEESKYFRPKLLNLSSGFVFAVLTRIDDEVEFDYKAFSLRIGYSQVNKTSKSKVYKRLSYFPCNKTYFLRNIPKDQNSTIREDYDLLDLNKAMCVDTNGLIIQGSEVNDFYSYIAVDIDFCKTLLEEKKECYSNTEFSDLFINHTITSNIYYVDTAYNAAIYPDVYSNFINEIKVKLTSQNAKETKVYFSNNTLMIEDGYIVTKQTVHNDKIVTQVDNFISVRMPSDRTSISYKLYSGTKINLVRITFMTFSEFLANVGGILTNLITIAQIIMYYVNNLSFEKSLIENLFRLEPDKDDKIYQARRRRLIIKASEKRIPEIKDDMVIESPKRKKSSVMMERLKENDDKILTETTISNLDLHTKEKDHKKSSRVRECKTPESRNSNLTPISLRMLNAPDLGLVSDFSRANQEGVSKNTLRLQDIIPASTSNLKKRDPSSPCRKRKTIKFLESEKDGYAEILSDVAIGKNEIKFDPKDFYRTYFCSKCDKSTKKYFLRHKALEHILDILNYMYDYSKIYNTIREQELLKYLILDEEQLFLFNFTPPPRVFTVDKNSFQKDSDLVQMKYKCFSEYYNKKIYEVGDPSVWTTKEENFSLFIKAIEELKNRKPKTDLDKKLLENFI